MGLFDFGGGGDMDLSQLLQYFNPVGSAQAANTMSPGAPLTEDALRNAYSGENAVQPVAGLPPAITQPATRSVQPSPAPAPPAPEPVPAQGAFRLNPAGTVTNDQRLESGIAPNTPLVPPPAEPPVNVGASLTGRQVGGGSASSETAPTDANAQAPGGLKMPDAKSLAGALRGVQAPPQPQVQKISSPNAPRPTGTIKAGNLAALLALLGAGGGARPTLGGRG